MDIKFTIFLYSKYSENSKRFMNIFKEKVSDDIANNLKFINVCIDNEKIRNSITNSKQISIKVVPCILIIYTDGGAQKYEGPDAFTWLEDIITKINIDIDKEKEILYEKHLIEKEKQEIMYEKMKLEEAILLQQQMSIQQQQDYEQEEEEEEEEEEIKNHPPPQPQPKKKIVKKIKKLPIKKEVLSKNKKTSIKELESEENEDTNEEENEDTNQNENVDIEENLEEIFEPYENENENENEKSKDALSLKKESLMNAAMAMQKTRDSQDSVIKKPIMNR